MCSNLYKIKLHHTCLTVSKNMFHLNNLDHPSVISQTSAPNQETPFLLVKTAFISLLPKLGMSWQVRLDLPPL
ncbi:hypothetical protein HOLleu_12885 [Holothuria leucospilota]|uniref:Uncharacterized protein n=1 Tax=Holothuria leucospilota TaxID=206669 RepID=A0A9Q1CCA7_HOLLE|nr:hypothetical protein HOLleu_12885 [Holothuria leucospilota]